MPVNFSLQIIFIRYLISIYMISLLHSAPGDCSAPLPHHGNFFNSNQRNWTLSGLPIHKRIGPKIFQIQSRHLWHDPECIWGEWCMNKATCQSITQWVRKENTVMNSVVRKRKCLSRKNPRKIEVFLKPIFMRVCYLQM